MRPPWREFAFLSDGVASVESEGHRYWPWGFLALPSKVPHMAIAKGGRSSATSRRLRLQHSTGTGPDHKVADDVLDGVVTATVLRDYGVVVSVKLPSTCPQPTSFVGA